MEISLRRMKSSRSKRLLATAGWAALAILSNPAWAAAPPVPFAIGALPLDEALKAYGRITGRQLLYTAELVAGRTAAPLQGRYSADEALRRLLPPAGIGFRQAGDRVIVLFATPAAQKRPRERHPPARQSEPSRSANDDVAIAASEAEIVVTGTNIRGQHRGPSPIDIISRDDIDRGGYGTVAQAVAALPQNFIGAATDQDRPAHGHGAALL